MMMVKFILPLLWSAVAMASSSSSSSSSSSGSASSDDHERSFTGSMVMGFLNHNPADSPEEAAEAEEKTCTPDQVRSIMHDMYMKVVEYSGVPAEMANNPHSYKNMDSLEIDLAFVESHCEADANARAQGRGTGNAFGLNRLSNGMDGSKVHCAPTDDASGGRRDLLLAQEEKQHERELSGCNDPNCYDYNWILYWWECPCFGRRRLDLSSSLRGGQDEETKLVTYPDGSTRRLSVSDALSMEELTSEGKSICFDLDVSECVPCSDFRVLLM